jgi:hypothetical protein
VGEYARHAPMFAAMLDSVWINPEYQESILKYSAQLLSIKRQTKNRADSHLTSLEQATLEHPIQQFDLYTGKQAPYRDPATGETIHLSSDCRHVWTRRADDTSEYILTGSSAYNPKAQGDGAQWTEMQRVR